MRYDKNAFYVVLTMTLCAIVISLICNWRILYPTTKITPTAGIQRAAQEDAKRYTDKLDSLSNANVRLQKQAELVNSKLQEAKQKNTMLQHLVGDMITRTGETIDTIERLAVCDSIQVAVQEMIVTDIEEDSLYEVAIGTFKETIHYKDSTISVHEQMQASMQLSFDKCLSEHELLYSENERYRKQLNQQHAKNKILTAGLLLIAGFATYSFITH